MQKSTGRLMPITLMGVIILFFTSCGNNDNSTKTASPVDTEHVTGPGPDNNSANNPSLADTAYEKGHKKPITDTLKTK